jgi:hypothetical protein
VRRLIELLAPTGLLVIAIWSAWDAESTLTVFLAGATFGVVSAALLLELITAIGRRAVR